MHLEEAQRLSKYCVLKCRAFNIDKQPALHLSTDQMVSNWSLSLENCQTLIVVQNIEILGYCPCCRIADPEWYPSFPCCLCATFFAGFCSV